MSSQAVSEPLWASAYLLGVPLPPSANLAHAFLHDARLPDGLPTHIYTATGAYIDIPFSVAGTYTTSAVISPRTVILEFRDEDSHVLASVVAPRTQAESLAYGYFWNTDTSTAYNTGPYNVMPLPQLPLMAGYQLRLARDAGDAADAWTNAALTFIRVPTDAQAQQPVARPTEPILMV